jgi:hypothetical protein
MDAYTGSTLSNRSWQRSPRTKLTATMNENYVSENIISRAWGTASIPQEKHFTERAYLLQPPAISCNFLVLQADTQMIVYSSRGLNKKNRART